MFFCYCYYFRKNSVYESNKPLLLPAGCDSFDRIDNDANEVGDHIRSMHKYKNVFASIFKQVNYKRRTRRFIIIKKIGPLERICLLKKKKKHVFTYQNIHNMMYETTCNTRSNDNNSQLELLLLIHSEH